MSTLKPEPSWFEIDPEFYRHGGNCLSSSEMLALADCAGERLLVTPAVSGEEALSLAGLGATVSVFDSLEGSKDARALFAAVGSSIASYEGVPGSPQIPGGPYDTVYSTFGILNALEYFDDWAQGIADALKPGGRLVIHDAHPMSYVPGIYKGIFAIAHSYFGDGADAGAATWTMADLVSALGIAGLATVHLEEMPDSERYQTPLDRFQNVRWDVRWRVPGAFVLVAFKP